MATTTCSVYQRVSCKTLVINVMYNIGMYFFNLARDDPDICHHTTHLYICSQIREITLPRKLNIRGKEEIVTKFKQRKGVLTEKCLFGVTK